MLKKITRIGYFMIRVITTLVAAVFLIYSTFTLWDMYRTEIRAFASYDLLQYRPNIEEDEPPYLDELVKINSDTAAWVTIYGTNIDYPVFQGKTDMEYLNKDAYKKFTITGSIFMSVLNKKNFSDPYTLLYGHHMANGSMFGDIDKFKKKDFFYNKGNSRFEEDEGVLIMENKVYNLKVFAIVETSAYDHNIYRSDKSEGDIEEFLEYAKTKSKYTRDVGKIDKILAMSTCNDATTEGRSVLLCKMEKRTEPLPTREEEPLTPHRKAVGHPMAGAYWAVLNMFCLALTLYTVIPLHVILSRFIKRRKDNKEQPKENKEKKKLSRKDILLRISLIGAGACSLILFIATEDLHKPMQVIDTYTFPMILLLAAAWFVRVKIEKVKSPLFRVADSQTQEAG